MLMFYFLKSNYNLIWRWCQDRMCTDKWIICSMDIHQTDAHTTTHLHSLIVLSLCHILLFSFSFTVKSPTSVSSHSNTSADKNNSYVTSWKTSLLEICGWEMGDSLRYFFSENLLLKLQFCGQNVHEQLFVIVY